MNFDRLRQAAFAVAAAVVTAGFGFAGSTVQAATLTLQGEFVNKKGTRSYTKETARATLSCTLGCQGIYSTATTGGSIFPTVDPDTFGGLYDEAVTDTLTDTGFSDLFDAQSAGDPEITTFINRIVQSIGGGANAFSEAEVGANKRERSEGEADSFLTFTTDAEWLIFKIGKDPNLTVVRNERGSQQFDLAATGQGAGWSSVTFLGGDGGDGVTVPEISATGSVAALGSVFALMAFLLERRAGISRRRRSVA